MINFRLTAALFALAIIAATSAAATRTAPAASMGTSRGQDLDALLSQAREKFGLTGHDAVLLFEGQRVAMSSNGDKTTRFHRVVWIGTAMGIRDHADLRIPYHSDNSTLTVDALRTWRDGRWWPDAAQVSATAVVETLPFDLAQADDYTGMRETMLLHDGVELPCVMETVWEIEERGAATSGTDGLWVFPQRDPAARVEYTLTVPAGETLHFRCGNGAPDPVVTRETDGSTTHAWTMESVGRLGSPSIADPAGYAPYVSWSTWESWEALGEKIVSSFDGAAALSEELADTAAGRIEDVLSESAKAKKIATFVDEITRSIHYDSRFWAFSPRPASRTWETAYGHALDRAVLAAALFREAGLESNPIYRSIGGGVDIDVPGLSRFAPVILVVRGGGMEAFYDPYDGTLTDGAGPFFGRFVWTPGTDDRPSPGPGLGDTEATNEFTLAVTLEPADDGSWTGTGYLSANGCFSPHADMVGVNGEALALLNRIAGSVLPGSTVEAFNPEVFARDDVRVGFAIKAKAMESDDRGRMSVTIGEPAGGIMSRLQPDVHLYHENRSSPVTISGNMTQRITLRLKTGEREIVQLPESREIDNEAGRYVLTSDHANGWVTIERELALRGVLVGHELWPDLRALLLEEADADGRTILMK